MNNWIIKFHPEFLEDLGKLHNSIVEMFEKKKEKIKQNPLRLEHLSGGLNCYREAITDNVRAIYLLKGNEIWFLTINTHEKAYSDFQKRLYSLRNKYKLI